MKGRDGYAVFFFPQALEALGDAIKPYIQDSPVVGPHVPCDEIDTGGALIEITMKCRMPSGDDETLELMVPSSMVRMIVSRQSGGMFGFGPRSPAVHAAVYAPIEPLPVLGATAPGADAPAQGVPASGGSESPAVVAPAEGDTAAKPAP